MPFILNVNYNVCNLMISLLVFWKLVVVFAAIFGPVTLNVS